MFIMLEAQRYKIGNFLLMFSVFFSSDYPEILILWGETFHLFTVNVVEF